MIQVRRRLEDKFYGLELNHIACCYNETADELAKISSGRTTVPLDVFSRDLHQPSVKIDDTPEPEAPSAHPEVRSAQSEAPSARPQAPLVQPEVPSAPEGETLQDRKSTRLNSSHITRSRMPSSA